MSTTPTPTKPTVTGPDSPHLVLKGDEVTLVWTTNDTTSATLYYDGRTRTSWRIPKRTRIIQWNTPIL